MTYCLGLLVPAGLVLASDSRSNAGVDQVAQVRKLAVFTGPNQRVIVVLSAGNLATSQAVVTSLREAAGSGRFKDDLQTAPTMFEVALMIGGKLRDVTARDAAFVQPYGDPNVSFLVGGQIGGEAPRLFQIYSAGNFIEASDRCNFLQIGETKYGKPILDRALGASATLGQAAKLALLSFDATLRSNLSVGEPIDILCYEANSFSTANLATLHGEDAYWTQLRQSYSDGLSQLVAGLPPPPVWGY
jgi:putative proteasome-type protease